MKNLNQSGFTLLEVLIAMIILAIGLLGLAGLQANSMRFNNSAYLRSQASFLATDIADKMRANQDEVTNGSFNDIDTTNTYNIGTCYTSSGCSTTSQMATSSIAEWKSLLESVLPSGKATVTSGANDTFTVSITWVDNTAGASIADKERTFSTIIKP
ncbi:MAG: type IV pilus modification protein PilV [Proteobacteria bacterium]|nr:type IV pilus modification protein PilV [Pseudomonadota bacterium]